MMTQNKKTILYIDLCGRLPYNTIISVAERVTDGEILWNDTTLTPYLFYQFAEEDMWDYVKPYLRPMDAKSPEEMQEYKDLYYQAPIYRSNGNAYRDVRKLETLHIDWLNSRHFDHRGLIEAGLALKATDEMYKEDCYD